MTVRCLSRFHLLRPLTADAAGDVFLAEDLRDGRQVAVKILPPALCHNLLALEELKHAADLVLALRHPNICAIEQVDEREGHHFLVMEALEGTSLRDMVAAGGCSPGQLLTVGLQSSDALQAAHRAGVTHGDLTPRKIFITHRGVVKILGFCLAHARRQRCWRASAPADTLAYAAPEELLGGPVDARADLFSLGVVLYEMATGRRPFEGATLNALSDCILHHTPERAVRLAPELPPALDWAIHRCLARRPELRYQSAAQLRDDLARVSAQKSPDEHALAT